MVRSVGSEPCVCCKVLGLVVCSAGLRHEGYGGSGALQVRSVRMAENALPALQLEALSSNSVFIN